MLRLRFIVCLLGLATCTPAFAQSGFVRSGGQPIPGASVSAKQGSQTYSTTTDADGHYAFPLLGPGLWIVTVDMFGFEPFQQAVDFAAAKGPVNFNVKLKESPIVQRLREFAAANNGNSGPPGRPGSAQQSFDQQLEQLNSQQQTPATPRPGNQNSNEAFLVSGSLSPGMAQGVQADSGPDMRLMGQNPFGGMNENPNVPGFGESQSGGFGRSGAGFGGGRGGFGGGFGGRGGFGRAGRAPGAQFGHYRRPSQIRGQLSFTLNNSALDAKPFSLNGLDIPQAAYAQSRFSLILGGPLIIPKIVKDSSTQFFITYFGTRARNPELFVETVPTQAEREGNFSAATQVFGTTSAPVEIFNPINHQQFSNNIIPNKMLNPIAMKLLSFYPLPNEPGNANNYELSTTQIANTDNFGMRVQRNITSKDRFSVNFQYQDRGGTTAQPFAYSDLTSGYGTNVQLQWTRNLSATAISNAQVRFNRNVIGVTPYFSFLPDVSAQLGIPGISNNPINYGPPTLTFTNFGSLSDSTFSLTRNQTQSGTESVSLIKGVHTVTLGVSFARADLSTLTDPNGRGTFSFTGLATSAFNANGEPVPGTGYDFADFLLGLPQSSSIRYGSTSNYFLENQWIGYAQDEWKARANLTLTAGVRYEYFSPLAEKYGRMANLDIGPGFTKVAIVTPATAGPYTGAFPNGLIDPDYNNFAPRIGIAWKLPWTKQSTIVRAGYGIYYNEQAYIPLAEQLAQQPPFAISNAVNTSAKNPLTLEKGFLTTSPRDITNTFAIDRFYHTPYAGTWSVTIEHDFGAGLFVELGYLGTKGTDLDVRIVPNQYPPGSPLALIARTQLGNAVGFTYDEPVGNSIFNALQLRAVRRFHRGLSFNAYYQFAKSIDDSSTFGGVGNTTAQNWLDIEAERGLSSFDVRHELQTSLVWTSPIAGSGSHIAPDSKTGKLLKDWQLSGGITAQTGNPLTARVLGNTAQLAQTAGIGSQRAEATGEPIQSSTGFFNLDAFTIPAPGTYGNAGRNTIPGPGLFSLNLAFGRSFNISERRRIEFRVESNNLLNHVNYTNLYTVVNAVNYGLPSAAGAMRTLDAVVRFRF